MHRAMKAVVTGIWTLLFLLGVFLPSLWAEATEEILKKDFPSFVFDRVVPTAVKGIYAVIYAGQEVVYYVPEAGVLITGEMIAKGGVNLTDEVKSEIMTPHYKDIPLEKGLKIGTGKNTVVEITDPDCPYCRSGAQYFADRTDVTRYVFFWPLSPDSEQKVRHILCAKDRIKMYEEVMAGKYDEAGLTLCQDPAVDSLMKDYHELGARIGMTGTPIYFVNGKSVRGANIPVIEGLLKGTQGPEPTKPPEK